MVSYVYICIETICAGIESISTVKKFIDTIGKELMNCLFYICLFYLCFADNAFKIIKTHSTWLRCQLKNSCATNVETSIMFIA